MLALEHLMGVTFTASQWLTSFLTGIYSPKWDLKQAFSELGEKYLQLHLSHLFNSTINDSKVKDHTRFVLNLMDNIFA